MGAYDFMVNMSQAGQISDLQNKVAKLEKEMKVAREWVEYLNGRLAVFEEMLKNMPPEAISDAEKSAYAFGWFKALEVQRNKNGN